MNESECTLQEFLNFLKISCGFSFDIDKHTFGERIKLQKYVFLAMRMGLMTSMPLDYNIYIRGPYSSSLADIYFNMDSWGTPIFKQRFFDAPKYISIISAKDTKWLEIASTIIFIVQNSLLRYKRVLGPNEIVEQIQKLKKYGQNEILSVYHELKGHGLMQRKELMSKPES